MSLEEMFRGEPALVPAGLRGYRTWMTSGEAAELVLSSTGVRWTYGPAGTVEEAVCLRGLGPDQHGLHEPPASSCHCGFYGWYSPGDARIVPAPVFGVVEATGRVVLGTHGFRAERLRVVALAARDEVLRGALQQAGFHVFGERDELLQAYPPQDVSGLVDHTCDVHCEAVPTMSWHSFVLHLTQWQGFAQRQVLGALQQVAAAGQTLADALSDDGTDAPVDRVDDPKWAAAIRARRNRGTGPARAPRAPQNLPGRP